jgi:hypothetical protein
MKEISQVICEQKYLDILNFTYNLEGAKSPVCLNFENPPAPDCFYFDEDALEIGIEHTSLIIGNHPKMGDAQRVIQKSSNVKGENIIRLQTSSCMTFCANLNSIFFSDNFILK